MKTLAILTIVGICVAFAADISSDYRWCFYAQEKPHKYKPCPGPDLPCCMETEKPNSDCKKCPQCCYTIPHKLNDVRRIDPTIIRHQDVHWPESICRICESLSRVIIT